MRSAKCGIGCFAESHSFVDSGSRKPSRAAGGEAGAVDGGKAMKIRTANKVFHRACKIGYPEYRSVYRHRTLVASSVRTEKAWLRQQKQKAEASA
jgi:hypothetical protein